MDAFHLIVSLVFLAGTLTLIGLEIWGGQS